MVLHRSARLPSDRRGIAIDDIVPKEVTHVEKSELRSERLVSEGEWR